MKKTLIIILLAFISLLSQELYDDETIDILAAEDTYITQTVDLDMMRNVL